MIPEINCKLNIRFGEVKSLKLNYGFDFAERWARSLWNNIRTF